MGRRGPGKGEHLIRQCPESTNAWVRFRASDDRSWREKLGEDLIRVIVVRAVLFILFGTGVVATVLSECNGPTVTDKGWEAIVDHAK